MLLCKLLSLFVIIIYCYYFICICFPFAVAHGSSAITYSWKYGNNQSIVVNEDVKLSQFDIASYSHVNNTTYIKDSKFYDYVITYL